MSRSGRDETAPHATASDPDLVSAFLAGDEAAFDILVDRHAPRVYAVCLRYFGNAQDAEDALQDTFVTVLRRVSTYRGTAAFGTWLHRVAVNACHDLARRRSRRPREAGGGMEQLDGLAAAEDPLAARELGWELERALALLDDTSRTAVVLHDVQGLPYAEVAERLNLPVGTVKSRIHRGHARLADALAHLHHGGTDPGSVLQSREPTAPADPPSPRP